MSYREISRQLNTDYEVSRSMERIDSNNAKMDPGSKSCVGGILTAGFFGFAAGITTKFILGSILVAAGVTATAILIVGAVVVGIVVTGVVLYCIYKS